MSQARLSLHQSIIDFAPSSEQAHGPIRIEDRPDPVMRRALVAPVGSPLAARRLERPVPAPERVVSFTSLHRAGAGLAELSVAHLRPANTIQTCLHCGHLQVTPLSKRLQTCLRCGWRIYQNRQPRLNIKEAEWER